MPRGSSPKRRSSRTPESSRRRDRARSRLRHPRRSRARYPPSDDWADQRWAVSCNADSQRLFDEELDGLGFQLKEWPWHVDRQQLFADWCRGLVDSVAKGQPADVLRQMEEAFLTSSRYELAFWEMAWTREKWPV